MPIAVPFRTLVLYLGGFQLHEVYCLGYHHYLRLSPVPRLLRGNSWKQGPVHFQLLMQVSGYDEIVSQIAVLGLPAENLQTGLMDIESGMLG